MTKLGKMLKIDVEKLRNSDASHLFWMDLTILIIIIINLFYLLFGYLFQFHFFTQAIHTILPSFYSWYAKYIYPNVLKYDIIFVAIYVCELLFRWARSIYRGKYAKWWFYPFVHWYDVIMCIPINQAFSIFSFLRLFGLVFRLQRLGAFDVTKTFVFKKTKFVSDIMVEEVSDAVIVKMLTMAQEEVQKGSPVFDKIVTNVIKPKEDIIVKYLTNRVGEAMNIAYTEYRGELKQYTYKIVGESINENKELKTLNYIPGLGNFIKETLDRAVADITFNTIDKLMKDIIDPENTRGIKEVTHALIETFMDHDHKEGEQIHKTVVAMVNESLEEVKQVVNQKEWKIKQLREEKSKLEEKIKESKEN